MGGFSSAALLEQKIRLYDECIIDDDGSPECKALDNAIVDLLTAVSHSTGRGAFATSPGRRLTQANVNKAALAVHSAAAQFGASLEKQADEWVVRAFNGERTYSLLEQSVALFHECEASEEGARAPSKCKELERALEGLRVALSDVKDMRGNVVPVSQMSDYEYKFHRRLHGHDEPRPRRRRLRAVWKGVRQVARYLA